MKKLVMFLCIGVFLSSMIFAREFNTGDVFGFYFPNGATKVANKSGSESKCYISEISKAANYPEGTYNLRLISADWVGGSVFPLYFNYIVKKEEILEFSKVISVYLGREPVKLRVINISENKIEVEEITETSFEEVKPSEDSL